MTIFAEVTDPDAPPLMVHLLILPETSLLSLASVMEPLRGANRVAGRARFHWRLFSVDEAVPASSSGLPIAVEGAYEPDGSADALIVLSSFNVDRHGTPGTLALLRRAARGGGGIGAVEAGSWLLARAGLLAGRRATTHWEDLEDFAAAHPDIDVRPDRFVIDGRFFTTGGASPALDLMLHLVRVRHGYAIALDVASLFIYDQSRPAEAPQPQVSLGHLGWREPRLRDAVALMEQSLGEPRPVAEIAAAVGCSPRRLEELFAARLGAGPYAYYLSLRLNAGRRMVLSGSATMAQIADATGFSSASGFARAFRSRFGESPTAARRRSDQGWADRGA
ncbi:MAG: GlxA family transcriptional regulator [Pseudomonadota bacterium]